MGDSRGSEAPAEPMNLGLTARQMPRPPIFAVKQDGTPPACVVVQPAHDYHLCRLLNSETGFFRRMSGRRNRTNEFAVLSRVRFRT